MPVRFLIIRFSSIGDIVLTTPVIRCVKEQVEDAEIIYLTKKAFEPVLANNPYIDFLLLYDGDISKTLEEAEKLRPDYILDLHHNLRTLRLKKSLHIPSFSFHKLNLEKWLLVNFKFNRMPDKHIVDRYLETAAVFNVKNDGKGLDYFLGEKDRHLPKEIKSQIPSRFIAMVIGAGHETKKATDEKLAAIADLLELPLVLLGSEGDAEKAARIRKLSTRNLILDLTGKISLNTSAYLVELSTLVITHDTGLMHIASAFKKPVLSLWGNTVPELGMYPYLADPDSRIFEVMGLSCRPCSKIGFERCPKKHFRCMNDLDEKAIASYANELAKRK